MAFAATPSPAQLPLGDINTTPLIDVLLVLLVMLVITIPAATHSLEIEVATCGDDCVVPPLEPLRNRLVLDHLDRTLWNGHLVSKGQLIAALAATRELPVEPELQFAPDPAASYDAAARTLRTIKASGVTKFGFVGNERFRTLSD